MFAGTFAVYPWLAGIGIVGILITAALFLLMVQQLFFGELPARWQEFKDLRGAEVWVLLALLIPVVAIGVYSTWLLSVVESGAASLVVIGRASCRERGCDYVY